MATGSGAIGGCPGEYIIDMAGRTIHAGMPSNQGEAGLIMIHRGGGPGRSTMANLTVGAVSVGGMIRCLSIVVFIHMASGTDFLGGAMLKDAGTERNRVMTQGAVLRRIPFKGVIWACSLVIGSKVTPGRCAIG